MVTIITLSLGLSALFLILATSAVFLLLWNDSRRQIYLNYGMLLITLFIWIFASIFLRVPANAISEGDAPLQEMASVFEYAFAGTLVMAYLLTNRLTDTHSRSVQWAVVLGIVLLIVYRTAFSFLDEGTIYTYDSEGLLRYRFPRADNIIYTVFALGILSIAWRHKAKFEDQRVRSSLLLFGSVQLLALVSPQFRAYGLPEALATLAALIVGYSFVHYDIFEPLRGRNKQLEVMRDVGVALTSELESDEVLSSIAEQAANLVQANGSAIYLMRNDKLVLEAVYNIPVEFLGVELALNEGLAGTVSQEERPRLLQDYRRDWKGKPDMPLALESFGSVLGVPLTFRYSVVGVLLVIMGRAERFFTQSDLQTLSLIAPQAAVSIANSQLFEQERGLRGQVLTGKQQLEAVLGSTENPVLAIDRHLTIIFANPAAENLLRLPSGDIRLNEGDSLRPFLTEELIPQPRTLIRDLLREQSHTYEIHLNDHDYLAHVARLNKPMRGWVVVLNDVTKLKAVDRLKSQMVRMTSHDLKNPLFAIMTYMELLEDDGVDIFDEDMSHYVQSIWKQLTRMQRIIGGILDLEKIQSGAPPMTPCNINTILTHIVGEISDQAVGKNQHMEVHISENLGDVIGDSHQLSQAFANLLDNAIKYTPSGGSIFLRAYNQEQTIVIEIEDSGIGIPRDVQNQVFDRFFRVQSSSTAQVSGSGLGLSLVKSIVDYHKGRVWLRSEEGIGSTFYIALPLSGAHSVPLIEAY